MKGQSEIVTFVLLFLIGLLLFAAAIAWSGGIFQKNVDIGKTTVAENFIGEVDSSIQSVIKNGGSRTIDYRVSGTIELTDAGYNDAIEIKTSMTANIPRYWINITRPGSLGTIREMLDGTVLRIQLSYPEQDNYAIDLFTDGPKAAQPERITIEKNDTFIDNGKTIIRIKLTF